MIDDTKNPLSANAETEFHLPPPARFDERASANAQPVQPLAPSRHALWMRRVRDAQRTVSSRTKALALVVIGGLAIGATSGAMLVKRHESSVNPPVIEQSKVETAAIKDPIIETPATRETIGEQGEAIGMQSPVQPARIRRHRSSPRTRPEPRAYRVGVLK